MKSVIANINYVFIGDIYYIVQKWNAKCKLVEVLVMHFMSV